MTDLLLWMQKKNQFAQLDSFGNDYHHLLVTFVPARTTFFFSDLYLSIFFLREGGKSERTHAHWILMWETHISVQWDVAKKLVGSISMMWSRFDLRCGMTINGLKLRRKWDPVVTTARRQETSAAKLQIATSMRDLSISLLPPPSHLSATTTWVIVCLLFVNNEPVRILQF